MAACAGLNKGVDPGVEAQTHRLLRKYEGRMLLRYLTVAINPFIAPLHGLPACRISDGAWIEPAETDRHARALDACVRVTRSGIASAKVGTLP
jgi:hypothetical protein